MTSTTTAADRRGWNPVVTVLVVLSVLFLVFLMVSGFLFLNRFQADWKSSEPSGLFASGKGAIGLLEVEGIILDSKKFIRQLKRFVERTDIKGIVVRVDSPGGSVAPSQEIFEALKKVEKPLVVSMGSVAASGGYYISLGAKKIYANPGTLTGSIGVIMEFMNLEKLLDWAKIKRYALTTGKFKSVGSSYREMTPEERALLQEMINEVLLQFKTAVHESRKLEMEAVTKIADGRIMNGSKAKELGLIDELGGLEDAVRAVAELADLGDDPEVVTPHKEGRFRLLDFLLDQGGDDDEGSESRLRSLVQGTFFKPGLYWIWHGSR